MSRCENCNCKVYNGACVNCHEEVYIMEQYYDLQGTEHELPLPEEGTEFMKNYNRAIKEING